MINSPLLRPLIAWRHRRQRQRDWSEQAHVAFGRTSLTFCTNIGLGDRMIVKQFCESFTEHCRQHGDPKLGRVVVSAGAWLPEFKLPRGDIHIYWWWSMSGKDQWLDEYLAQINIKPELVCCLSQLTMDLATAGGLKTLYLPLAVGNHFKPLNLPRRGVGYGGSKGHKNPEQERIVIEPMAQRPDFEWVDNLKGPEELNAFYNRKQIVLGMTEQTQERYGMVNNRVFEVLASGTPFIIHRHGNLENTLGFAYPYQASTPQQTLQLADKILGDFDRALETFAGYSDLVRREHTWAVRVRTLLDHLARN